jgi:hypothetical protein
LVSDIKGKACTEAENRLLKGIFGSKREEMIGGWRKLHNEGYTLYTLPEIIKMAKEDEMGRACSKNGGEEECIQGIGGKARRKETTRKMKT